MSLMLGILGDSYRRQLREISREAVIDTLLDKVVSVAQEFHIQSLGLDFSVDQLASIEPGYLDELKARFDQLNIVPTAIVGSLVLHADQELLNRRSKMPYAISRSLSGWVHHWVCITLVMVDGSHERDVFALRSSR